ncbi:MAG: hypothetical protein KJT01_06460 [Gemmatimonadetes bacterium]|nr:hypothetical protein [Gemmatimonadota bacterium]
MSTPTTSPTTPPAMTCARFEALLGDLMDEAPDAPLDAATREACGRHRGECPACAALLADLSTIREAAALLPAPAPGRDLWEGIAARLDAPVLPMASGRAAARPPLPWRRLAVAAVALVTVSAGVTWSVVRRDPASDGTPAVRAVRHAEGLVLDSLYGREIAVLREAAEGTLGQLDSATVAVVRRNLAIIDQAIRESRAALAADPGSPFLQEQLDRAYGEKVALLRRLTLL